MTWNTGTPRGHVAAFRRRVLDLKEEMAVDELPDVVNDDQAEQFFRLATNALRSAECYLRLVEDRLTRT